MGNRRFVGGSAPLLVDLGHFAFAFCSLLEYNAFDGSQALPGNV
jgi:hypothetical protein